MLDGEAIALQPDGRPHPFQVTGSRFGSRTAVDTLRREIPLTPFIFDILHADGEDLLDQPAEQRGRRLAAIVPESHAGAADGGGLGRAGGGLPG